MIVMKRKIMKNMRKMKMIFLIIVNQTVILDSDFIVCMTILGMIYILIEIAKSIIQSLKNTQKTEKIKNFKVNLQDSEYVCGEVIKDLQSFVKNRSDQFEKLQLKMNNNPLLHATDFNPMK